MGNTHRSTLELLKRSLHVTFEYTAVYKTFMAGLCIE